MVVVMRGAAQVGHQRLMSAANKTKSKKTIYVENVFGEPVAKPGDLHLYLLVGDGDLRVPAAFIRLKVLCVTSLFSIKYEHAM